MSTGTPSLCLDILGLGFQTGPPEHVRPLFGHRPWATLLLVSCSSAHLHPAPRAFGERKQDRRQTFAKRDRSTFSSRSLGVANLGEKVGVELVQGTVCSCMEMHSLYVYIHLQRSKEGSLLYQLLFSTKMQPEKATGDQLSTQPGSQW